MATYEYRCPDCGPFDLVRPIGTAPKDPPCPACSSPSARVFSSPALAQTPRAVSSLRQAEEASADAPTVVNAVPPKRQAPAAPAARNPMLAKLPRP
jgi:putative FmdB family regulatory protein